MSLKKLAISNPSSWQGRRGRHAPSRLLNKQRQEHPTRRHSIPNRRSYSTKPHKGQVRSQSLLPPPFAEEPNATAPAPTSQPRHARPATKRTSNAGTRTRSSKRRRKRPPSPGSRPAEHPPPGRPGTHSTSTLRPRSEEKRGNPPLPNSSTQQ